MGFGESSKIGFWLAKNGSAAAFGAGSTASASPRAAILRSLLVGLWRCPVRGVRERFRCRFG